MDKQNKKNIIKKGDRKRNSERKSMKSVASTDISSASTNKQTDRYVDARDDSGREADTSDGKNNLNDEKDDMNYANIDLSDGKNDLNHEKVDLCDEKDDLTDEKKISAVKYPDILKVEKVQHRILRYSYWTHYV